MQNGGEYVSLFLSKTLECMGYSEDMLLFRTTSYEHLNQEYASAFGLGDFTTLIHGSTAEGITTPFESKCDILFVKKNVSCCKWQTGYPQDLEQVMVFNPEQNEVPPGYTRLTLQHKPIGVSYEDDVYSSTFGIETPYLWSVFYLKRMRNKFKAHKVTLKENGPMIGVSMNAHIGTFYTDFPLIYKDEELFSSFRSRERRYGWPSAETINTISEQDVYVIPHSYPKSENGYLEWRISYSRSELLLVKALNITQIKLFILLKMITKSVLQHMSKSLTTYVMKNIVFWMAERYPPAVFEERNLVLLVLTALGWLYNCIKVGTIPCFLFDQRNLLKPTLDVHTKHDLLQALTILQQEKACMFLRCERLKCVMLAKYSFPDIVESYSAEKDQLEMCLMILNTIQAKYVRSSDKVKSFIQQITKDKDWLTVMTAVYDIVLPDWTERLTMGENIQYTVVNRIRTILG